MFFSLALSAHLWLLLQLETKLGWLSKVVTYLCGALLNAATKRRTVVFLLRSKFLGVSKIASARPPVAPGRAEESALKAFDTHALPAHLLKNQIILSFCRISPPRDLLSLSAGWQVRER
mmetsp:Transcript_2262/g.3299  ORF Transcript_2262/g.3299 Transcript_2262/m.3299 type:complete len:119 (+) Transcript_2262:1768-2124(+)